MNNREWKDVLEPISVIISKDATIKNAFIQLNRHSASIGFVTCSKDEIIGYFTSKSLLKHLLSSCDPNRVVVYETDIIFVRETDLIRKIYNCFVVIVANQEKETKGFVIINNLDEKIATLHLNSLNKALNSAEIGIVTLDRMFRVRFMNEKAEQIFGMKKEVFISRDYRKIIRSEENLMNVLKGERLFNIRNVFNSKKITGQYSPIYRDNKVTGIIHNFYLKEAFDEVVNQVDFVKEMSADLEAFYETSNEQIIITNEVGKIIKVAGAFFNTFFGNISKASLNGMYTEDLKKSGIFTPDIVRECIDRKRKVVMKQYGENGIILSTATPVIENGMLKRVIILSKNITVEQINKPSNINKVLSNNEPVIYQSAKMTRLMEEVANVSPLNSTVLISGESGVGKEVIARTIHQSSAQSNERFVAINCGAIPESLIESELFGHEKASFTGADTERIGLFEQAHNGTVFLDEIGELPYNMQVKLLRVLQEREISRIGATRPIPVNVRIIAATNRNLLEDVHDKKFREDLYYRLHIVPLEIPALRNRVEDVAPLAIYFLNHFNKTLNINKEKTISNRGLSTLESYEWPGNIRELRNVIERLMVISRNQEIGAEDVFEVLWKNEKKEKNFLEITGLIPLKQAVEETEKQLIELALKRYKTATKASEHLGVSISTISRRKKYFDSQGGGVR